MPYDILIGRDNSDKEKFGDRALVYLGKSYVKMGQYTSLSNKLWLDVARSHVILVAGKRGSGKSFSLGVIAEGISDLPAEASKNIAPLIFDTMGIFWTMKYENEKESSLLREWDLEPKKLPVKVVVPAGKAKEYILKGIPVDSTFALSPSELEAEDWLSLFNLTAIDLPGVLIERTLAKLKKQSSSFQIEDIKSTIKHDSESSNDTKQIVEALFDVASTWGIFANSESESTKISDLITGGTTTVLDVSVYSTMSSFNIRALVISLISKSIFKSRMDSRKQEELTSIQRGGASVLSSASARENPLVWIFIDEAHEFLPKTGKTPATDALIQLLREGRQPGISLVLATQQPGQIHPDVMTQSDIVLSHRLTSQQDIEALNTIMQTYLLEDIRQQITTLPSQKGSAIILDDSSERIYPMRVRPRFTWHGGESPASINAEIKL